MARAKQQEKRQVYRWPLHRPGFNLVGASAGAASADLCTIHSILLATVEAGERSEAAAAPEKKGVWCDSESTVGNLHQQQEYKHMSATRTRCCRARQVVAMAGYGVSSSRKTLLFYGLKMKTKITIVTARFT